MIFLIFKNLEMIFQGEFDGETSEFKDIYKKYLNYALNQKTQDVFKFVRIYSRKKFITKIQNGQFLKGF